MRALFEQLISEGEAGIDRLISERTQETVHLDFKRKRDPKKGRFDDEDRRVFGKALSAFANSDGGLLIWGVDARKGTDEIDCAQSPGEPISDIEQFRSEAIRLSAEILIPRHDGIRVEQIPLAEMPGSGYLLVQIDKSERRPHRCEAKGDKHYYKRAGDSSFAMEHYDIEDAFRRFTVPSLELGVRFFSSVHQGDGRILKGRLELFLENVSSVTAKMPYLQIRNNSGAGLAGSGSSGIIRHNEADWTSLSGDSAVVVHPGLSRAMAHFEIDFEWPKDAMRIGGKPPYLWNFYAECRFGSENAAATSRAVRIGERDLVRMMQGQVL